MRFGLAGTVAFAALLAACVREPVAVTVSYTTEEPAGSVAEALRRHLEPRDILIEAKPNEDPEAIVRAVLEGQVDFGILEEPARRLDGLTTIAPLYPSILHVLHRKGRSIADFSELIRGQQVYAGPLGSVAHRLLLQLAGDYMVADTDFTVLPDPWRVEPDVWFILGGLLPSNQQQGLAQYEFFSFGDAKQLGFGTQAEGLALKYPNVRPFILPDAVYASFNDQPILTLATRTVLIGRADLDDDLAYMIAREVFEHAHAIAAEYQLANDELNEEFKPSSLALPLHRGARTYLERDEPSLLERYAEVVGVALTLAAALGSGVLAVWRMNKARRKDRIDGYYRRVLAVRSQLGSADKDFNYNELTAKLKAIQEEVFDQLIAERLNVDESLTVFLSLSTQVLEEIAARRLDAERGASGAAPN